MTDHPRHDPAEVRRPLVAAVTALAVLALATALSGPGGDGGDPPADDTVRLASVGTVVRPGTEPEPVVGPAAASPTPVDNPADPADPADPGGNAEPELPPVADRVAGPGTDQSVSPGAPPGSNGRRGHSGAVLRGGVTSWEKDGLVHAFTPDAPTVLRTGASATLTWIGDRRVTYEVSVEVIRSGVSLGQTIYQTGSEATLELQGLSPSMQYRATVRGKGTDGLLSPPSAPVSLDVSSVAPLPAAGAAGTAAGTRLTLTYAARSDAAPRTWTLTCDPVGGDHPAAERACAVLARQGTSVFPPPSSPPQARACLQAVYGAETATLSGTWLGRQVTHRFTRNDSCEEHDWAAMVGLLPARAGVAGG